MAINTMVRVYEKLARENIIEKQVGKSYLVRPTLLSKEQKIESLQPMLTGFLRKADKLGLSLKDFNEVTIGANL